MSNIVEDKVLCDALKVHIIALSKNNSLDSFYENEVDLNASTNDEKYGYFITNFNYDKKEYLEDNKNTLEKEYENLKHLLES